METFLDFIVSYGIYPGALLISIASGFVPFLNSELFLVGLVLSPAHVDVVPVAGLAAIGQMIAKAIMYFSGRGIFNVSFRKYQDKVDKMMEKIKDWENRIGPILFLSAVTGFPPFYVLTVALGAGKYRFWLFLLIGLAGRFLRFLLLLLFPQYFTH